jgi:hypothetical protein
MWNVKCKVWEEEHWRSRVFYPKYSIFFTTISYSKSISLINSLFKVAFFWCNHVFAAWDSFMKNHQPNFSQYACHQLLYLAKKLLDRTEETVRSWRFKWLKRKKSTGGRSWEYERWDMNLAFSWDIKYKTTLTMWYYELLVWITNLHLPYGINRLSIKTKIWSLKYQA